MQAPNDCQIEMCGESLWLLPEKAIYWPARQTLIVSDLHIGKAATFRAAGVPVPEQTTAAILDRLSQTIGRTGSSRILCLGDLLHARSGRTAAALDAVAEWRARHGALGFVLVRGNHDAHSGDPPTTWGIECVDEPWDDGPGDNCPFTFRHKPGVTPGRYTLAGHIHPAIALDGAGRQRLTLPCFHFGPQLGILPAFGEFTGTALMRREVEDRVFVVAGERVVAITPPA
jgi:DNA ligase-associated metallophosphoesterase